MKENDPKEEHPKEEHPTDEHSKEEYPMEEHPSGQDPEEQHLKDLKEMYQAVKKRELGLLLAGLSVLAKDTADYINESGITDDPTEVFRDTYLDLLNYDRYYWEKFYPDLFLPLAEAGLPHGIVRKASKCEFDLSPLSKVEIEQEWTRAPGWHFFETYTGKIVGDIVGDHTLEKWKQGFFNRKDPKTQREIDPFETFKALAEKLARRGKFGPNFWYPLIFYVIELLIRTGFRTLEPGDRLR